MKSKYFVRTFGCQMNVSDSERIAGWYESRGWKLAEKIEEADEIVINTCSVRESAENRVYGLVNNLAKIKNKILNSKNTKKKFKKFKVILTGCMLRYPLVDLRKKLPAVDEFKKISEFILNSEFVIRNSGIHAFVPIMEGCNNFCSYCVVPSARGRERSRLLEEIICEVKGLVRQGYREITLLGQNVNSYGKEFNISSKFKVRAAGIAYGDARQSSKFKRKTQSFNTPFAKLLTNINEIDGLEKISFMTSNPWDLTDDIIEVMRSPKIDRYLHLPVQSGDDGILKKMNRKYTIKQYLDLIKKIREKIPDIKIGTDIIVGFPGETDKQFQNTVKLCRKVGFEKAYVSMYSPRPGTIAYKLKDDVLFQEKRGRWRVLEKLINEKSG